MNSMKQTYSEANPNVESLVKGTYGTSQKNSMAYAW